MLTTKKKKNEGLPNVLRRMRESSGLTMRQAGGLIGVSHVTISHFENEKLSLPAFRIEQFVKAYGFTMEEFNKIMRCAPIVHPRDECHKMIDQLDDDQLSAIRSVLTQVLRTSVRSKDTIPDNKMSHSENQKIEISA